MFRDKLKIFIASAFILVMPELLFAQSNINQALNEINENTLRGHIKFLSDDMLGGRAPASEGSKIAQLYISSLMQEIGLQPAFAGSSYYQKFDIVQINMQQPMQLSAAKNDKTVSFKYYDEFIVFPGVFQNHIQVKNAELVFVGYGIQAPEYKWDDYKDTDVRGKVVLIMNNDPDTGDPEFFGGKARLYYGRWDYKYEQAEKMGAVGAIIIHTTPSAGYPWQVVQSSWTGKQFELPRTKESPLKYKAWVTEDAAYQLAKLAGKDLDKLRSSAQKLDFKPVPLGITINGTINARYQTLKGTNVGGYLSGSDPNLKEQAVIFTAHYDHLGIGKAVNGDSIYNGALDNASGVASILDLARAYSELQNPPHRTLLFLAVDAEESGLLGSQYYAEHPTFPPGKIAADVNIDGVNIWGKTKDISIIGSGKSTIDEIVKKVAEEQSRIVLPDQMPEQGSFYRSDQFNFAKIGVPALYLSEGEDFVGRPKGWGRKVEEEWISTHYHQPTDEYEPDWDLSGAIQDLKLIFKVGYQIAINDKMPSWLPGDEFEAIRLKALQNTN